MKLAKASQAEITALNNWLQSHETAHNPPPPFMRVVFGYETLVLNVCDPAKDYLDFKPGYSPEEVDKLRAALLRIAQINQSRPAMQVANDCIAEAVKALS